jgi:molybdopterin molybdotransferase
VSIPISLLQAKTLALASVGVAPVKRVRLGDALGRFLAEGVSSKQPSPAADGASLDGYALASIDIEAARKDHPILLKLVEAAPDLDLHPGQAMRVRAGAAVPFGADAVVGLEHASDDGQRVTISTTIAAGKNVRRRGEEWAGNALLFPAGHRVDAATLGVLLSLGIEEVAVRPWPRVAVFAIGESTQTDVLLVMLKSLLTQAGAEVVTVERCAEREEAVAGMLDRLLPRAELLAACPGPSLASRELLKAVVKRTGGTWGFDGVAVKPGRHAALAMLRGKPVAVLPGPPIAALAAFEHLVWPMLLKRHGVVEKRRKLQVKLDAPIRKRPGRTLLVPARLEQRQAQLYASFRLPISAYLIGAAAHEGWVVLPPEQGDLKVGESVELELAAGADYAAVASGTTEEGTR